MSNEHRERHSESCEEDHRAQERAQYRREPLRMTMDSLERFMEPERTLVIGRNEEVLQQFANDAPFLKDPAYARATGFATQEDVQGKNIFGVLPAALEAQAETVTRYDIRPTLEQRAEKNSELLYTGQQVGEMAQNFVTYQVRKVEMDTEEILRSNPTFVTRHPEQVSDWRDRGLIGPEEPAVIILETRQDADSIDAGRLDEYTTIACREDHGRLPENSLTVYGHISSEEAPDIIDGHHVVGILPPHLRNRAELMTQFDYNPRTGEYGEGATFQTRIIMRTPIGE